MAFSATQTSTPVQSAAAAVAVTLSATTVGNIVVMSIYITPNSETCSSVTDNQGNTYVVEAAVDSPGGERLYQCYGVQVVGGATTVTANFSGAVATKRVFADEYGFDGFAWTSNATAFDASTTGNGTGSTCTVSTLTTLRTAELIVATFIKDTANDWTAGTNYTKYGGGAGSVKNGSEYRLSGAATETAPVEIGASYTWAERAVAFRSPQTATINPNSPNPGDNVVTNSDSPAGNPNRYGVPNPVVNETITQTETMRGNYGWRNQSKSTAPTWSNQSKS
jgi:hypothetical protein